MKVPLYDFFNRSMGVGVFFIVVGIFTGIAVFVNFDIHTAVEFANMKNANGNHVGQIAIFEVAIGIGWMLFSQTVMASLKKGMTDEEIRKVEE